MRFLPLILLAHLAHAQTPATVAVSSTPYNTNTWEHFFAVGQVGQLACDFTAFKNYRLDVLDSLAALGVSGIRVAMTRGGFENDSALVTFRKNGTLTQAQYNSGIRWGWADDDADPNTITTAGYAGNTWQHFGDSVLVALDSILTSQGKDLYVSFHYVDFYDESFKTDPDEYAEYWSYLWSSFSARYGYYPHDLEMWLEPDNVTGAQMAAMINALVTRFAADGIPKPSISCCSPVGAGGAYNDIMYDTEAASSAAADAIDRIIYHTYSSTDTDANYAKIRSDVGTYGADGHVVGSWQGEGDATFFDVRDILDQIELADGVRYATFGAAFCSGNSLFVIDQTDPANPVISPAGHTPWVRWWRYVAPGATVITTTESTTDLTAVAFRNHDTKDVLVIYNAHATTTYAVTISGLTSDDYNVEYTNASTDGVAATGFSGTGDTINIPPETLYWIYPLDAGTWQTNPNAATGRAKSKKARTALIGW